MCYKACFYNGGHGRKKDRHIIIFARAYKGRKKEGTHTKTADGKQEKDGKTEGKLANLQNLQHLHTHTCAYIII